MSSVQQAAADLADVLYRQVRQASDQDPTIRGADWRLAAVATVGTDGTVTTTDGIIARRAETYVSPAVADTVIISVSGSGNWLAVGRLAASSTAGTWQTLPLAGAWSAWGSPFYTPAYRLNGNGTASLSGLARAPASTSGTVTVATLPAEARPANKVRFVAQVNTTTHASLDLYANGTVEITDYTGTAGWVSLDVVASYRLT